jgi:hypothetical protein
MKINIDRLKEFEQTINTVHPEKGIIPINLLGYGEISLVFEFADLKEGIAYKRLPIFNDETQIQRHIKAYQHYHSILNRLKISIPEEDAVWLRANDGTYVLYCAQEKIETQTIGNQIIHHQIKNKDIFTLVQLVMRKMARIWRYNLRSSNLKVGIDGQISNWTVRNYSQSNPKITDESELFYLDTSTPMFRISNVDAMEPILFLKSAPSFLRWLLKALFLEEVVGRYYDFRLVAIDLLANFYKEQRAELIPGLIKIINSFFSEEVPELNISPIQYQEVDTYYNGFLGDKQIWVIFQAVRKMDRYLQTRMLRKSYNFYLPGTIDR